MLRTAPARLRDLLLLLVATAGTLLGLILLAGRIWFAALFQSAFKGSTLAWAALLVCVAFAAALGYVLSPPPCASTGNGRIH